MHQKEVKENFKFFLLAYQLFCIGIL